MCEHARRDKIKNKVIHDKVGVASLADKMWEANLRLFGHIQRRCANIPMRKCERLAIASSRRGIGRLYKIEGCDLIGYDPFSAYLGHTLDRKVWRSRIRLCL